MTQAEILNTARQHHRAGQLAQAEALYRQFLALQPDSAEVLHVLGLTLAAQDRTTEAIVELRRAIEIRPDYPEAAYNLARALQDDGQLEAAVQMYRRTTALRPDFAPAYNNLGILLQATHDLAGAQVAFRDAIRLQPNYPEAVYNLGNVLKEQNRLEDAVASYRHALTLQPDYPAALVNLGNVLQRKGDLDEALALFRRAIDLNAALSVAHNSLGNALKDAGDLDAAIEAYQRSIAAEGGPYAWDNLLYTLHFHPAYDATRIAREHTAWNAQLNRPAEIRFPPNDCSPDRPLRIGYVSPDFREHPVGRFILPLLKHHNHDAFPIFCYSDVRSPDSLTRALQSHADAWRDSARMSYSDLVARIRDDRIDILIDLAMHMDGNRLLAFAQSPAPVLVTYLAYCSTTGLSSIHYRLSDPYLDPPGTDLSAYSETTIRLPRTYWCYEPPDLAPQISPLPASRAGRVTFGCLNNYSKVTGPTWELWFRILRDMPGSRLLVQSPRGSHRHELQRKMIATSLDPDRVTFVDRVPMADYFALYNQIDIALDPFPYGGGTTTCDALWMGVPVVTLTGNTAVSRGGSSILHNLGFPQWIASTPDEYAGIVRELAADLSNLALVRSQLRSRMLTSPLMDAPAFAADFESVLRDMWIGAAGLGLRIRDGNA